MERLALKPEEAARLLGVSTATVYRSIKAKEIDAERIGGRILIPAAALVARFGEPVEVNTITDRSIWERIAAGGTIGFK